MASLGWVASGVGTFLLKPAANSTNASLFGLIARVALRIIPWIFLVGLFSVLSIFTHYLYGVTGGTFAKNQFLSEAENGAVVSIAIWLGVIAVLGFLYAIFVDPNLFSLHNVYGNRLIRCYLAASRPKKPISGAVTGANEPPRTGDVFTGFDHLDDLSLLWLSADISAFKTSNAIGTNWQTDSTVAAYLGPYPLFNTTLNLVAGTDLATQDRKGESFFLSPGYNGSNATGFALFRACNTTDANNLTIGRAMTISGAAVDPNMQTFQSAGLTAMLTLLNLRLGWWIENPRPEHRQNSDKARDWHAGTPTSAWYLVKEAMGDTRADREYVHLSDGGHFDNMGGYELIRRRCRFVVLIDAAEDPNDASENLANLLRLVRTDFGIRIDLDTSPLHKRPDGRSPAHVAVGTIRYDDVDHGAVNGTLVFLRSSLTGDEPADLLNYAITNPPFPHHSTINQFFDEPQFESYRALGFHIGMEVFGPPKSEMNQQWRKLDENLDNKRWWYNRSLFSEIRRHWARLPAGLIDSYHSSVIDWLKIEEILRQDERLARLTTDIYPELGVKAPLHVAKTKRAVVDQKRVAEIRAMAELMQMMESAFLKLELDETFAHPVHRGWMNCLRRYSAAGAFQEYWPILRPLYSFGFVRFCERVLQVAPLEVELVQLNDSEAVKKGDPPKEELKLKKEQLEHITALSKEFDQEWAGILDLKYKDWEPGYLQKCYDDSKLLDGGKYYWILKYKLAKSPTRLPDFPIGFAAVRKWDPKDENDADFEKVTGKYELIFYIRGGYRSSGVGSDCLKLVMDQLKLLFETAKFESLLARFPRTSGSAADSQQRAAWTMFFNDHDFAAYRLPEEIAKWEVRVRYTRDKYTQQESISMKKATR